ncbi:hypothetical protein AB0873_27850 [Micromonospora sp. NPDC047707]|uniref:hypothetical protein n=1 Tax=unclassified Micromonospora TaxID=2617518 RepID=UPI0012B4EEB1|nr:hypothetical protein [Micromonospora sp. WMMC415]QGN46000.1 hypothetical protein GKC29_03465 [Micromonospora sp. WMMC415]
MSGPALLRTTVVALVAALAVAGCGSAGTSTSESSATTSVTETPGGVPTSGPGTSAPGTTAGGQPAGGGPTGTGATGGTGSSGGKSGAGSTTSTGPSITYFRVAQQPSCPAGTSANPIAGTSVVLEWKASNVDSVALSVDGPGVYADNYPPTGSETLNFPCSGSEGDVQRHTYLLTVRNAHGTQTKTLVVTATVHDVPEV